MDESMSLEEAKRRLERAQAIIQRYRNEATFYHVCNAIADLLNRGMTEEDIHDAMKVAKWKLEDEERMHDRFKEVP